MQSQRILPPFRSNQLQPVYKNNWFEYQWIKGEKNYKIGFVTKRCVPMLGQVKIMGSVPSAPGSLGKLEKTYGLVLGKKKVNG